LKEIRFGSLNAPALAAGHWMATQESGAGNYLASPIDNQLLRAAGVGDEGAGLDPGIEFFQAVRDLVDRLRQIQEVGNACGLAGRQRFVDYLPIHGSSNGLIGAHSNDASGETALANRKSE
jgi:hypothetical protein